MSQRDGKTSLQGFGKIRSGKGVRLNSREESVRGLTADSKSRTLELEPLNRPAVTRDAYPNCRHCDIHSTDEVKAPYSGNACLRATGIGVDAAAIVDIDYVRKGSCAEAFSGMPKFDCATASHVLARTGELLSSLLDIGKILVSGGVLCIAYPDRHYRSHFGSK